MSDQTLFFYESEQILISSKIKQQYIAQHSRATAARNHQVPVSVIRAGMGICRSARCKFIRPCWKTC